MKRKTIYITTSDRESIRRWQDNIGKRLRPQSRVSMSQLVRWLLELPLDEWKRWARLAKPTTAGEELLQTSITLPESDWQQLVALKAATKLHWWQIFSIIASPHFQMWAEGKLV